MNPALVAILLVSLGALVLALVLNRYQSGVIGRLRRQRDAIENEEHRMFEFLHGLGEALSREGAGETVVLHRTIVRGAAMVADAHGAALYLIDRAGERLVPKYQSEACPPLIPVPKHIADRAAENPSVLESYRRLTSVGRDWGPFGEVLASGRPRRLSKLTAHPAFERASSVQQRGTSVMLAPLIYGGKPLGVLAAANIGVEYQFTDNDFDVFRSIAEQSAFALGNAIVHQQAAEKRRLDLELATASEVQRILLPEAPPEVEGYQMAGANVPAKMVSGDYFDFFPVSENHHGVVIADVSGKGVPASLIMAMCRGVVRASAADTTSPAAVLAEANRQLFPDIREDMFISLAYIVLDSASGEVLLARAGHDPPLHYIARRGEVEVVQSPGMAIGIDSGVVFDRATRDHRLELESGDVLLLYTDGVNEATDVHGEEFGVERLHAELRRHAELPAGRLVDRIRAAVASFVGDVPQNDDITLIAVKRL